MPEKYRYLVVEPLTPNNEMLNAVAAEVDTDQILDPEVQRFIDRMFEFAYGRQGDAKRRTMVGLAAPQIGVPKRIIIVGVNAAGLGEQPDLHVFINPRITNFSSDLEAGREGCFSTGQVCGIVERASKIDIVAYDRSGKLVRRSFEGFPARVFQHEVDHLDGIRFPDRIQDDERLHWVPEEKFGEYRVSWQNWEQKCSRETWEAIKSGKSI